MGRIAQKGDEGQAEREAFSARLKLALGTRTPAWLARESGVGDNTIRKYLSGSFPTIIQAVKVADALDVRLSWLITGHGEMKGVEDPPKAKAEGHNLFDAAEADWVFLPHYRFESAIQTFVPIVTETYPVRRDWVKRALGVERGLWVTEMPSADLQSVAAEGESIVCRNVLLLEPGRAYILGLHGNLVVRRYTLDGFVTDIDGAPALSAEEAQHQGVFPVGEILARFGLSPIQRRL